jgi:hypothetical protein
MKRHILIKELFSQILLADDEFAPIFADSLKEILKITKNKIHSIRHSEVKLSDSNFTFKNGIPSFNKINTSNVIEIIATKKEGDHLPEEMREGDTMRFELLAIIPVKFYSATKHNTYKKFASIEWKEDEEIKYIDFSGSLSHDENKNEYQFEIKQQKRAHSYSLKFLSTLPEDNFSGETVSSHKWESELDLVVQHTK